jgi:hypothetical protein
MHRHVPPALLDALRDRIGTRGLYNGQEFELIEVLEHDPAVVLRDCGAAHTIQPDMHGEAHRMVNKTHTVPIASEVERGLHPVLKSFFPPETQRTLESLLAGGDK